MSPTSANSSLRGCVFFYRALAFFALLMLALPANAQSWSGITNSAGVALSTPLLLTDGSVMVQQAGTGQWWRLSPDGHGSYINGTWGRLATMPAGYAPLFYASAVLPDGRVVVMGGEFNGTNNDPNNPPQVNTGAIYNPVLNSWTPIAAPAGAAKIGDAASVVLPNGTFMLGGCCSSTQYLLNASNLTWSPTGTGKVDSNGEEGWVLLPSGGALTVDTSDILNSELFNPSTLSWASAGSTIISLISGGEVGPAVLRPDGTVFATGANSNTAIYNTATGGWSVGPTFPNGLGVPDGPAALLPDGNVLVGASPVGGGNGTQFFEFNGSNLLSVPAAPNAATHAAFVGRMLVLPTGQVLYTDGSGLPLIYTPSGTFQAAWQPTITSAPSTLIHGSTNNLISGTQFNGRSQGAMYGDDAQSATNYPLVRITMSASGDVYYAKTHNHSTMGVATGSSVVSTEFDVPNITETGNATLQVIANGIPSNGVAVTVPGPTYASGTLTIGGPGEQCDAGGSCDSGSVIVCFGGTTDCESAFYVLGDTYDTIASSLAQAINQNSQLVNAQASGSTIFINADVIGPSGNNITMQTSYSYSGMFPSPSFTATASGPTLTGGHN